MIDEGRRPDVIDRCDVWLALDFPDGPQGPSGGLATFPSGDSAVQKGSLFDLTTVEPQKGRDMPWAAVTTAVAERRKVPAAAAHCHYGALRGTCTVNCCTCVGDRSPASAVAMNPDDQPSTGRAAAPDVFGLCESWRELDFPGSSQLTAVGLDPREES